MSEMEPPVELVRTKDGLLISRRRLLQRGGMVGLAAAAAPVLAACGSSDGEKGSTGSGSSDFGSPTGFPRERWNPSAPAGTKPDLPKRFAYAIAAPSGEFTEIVVNNAKLALEGSGIEVLTADANGDAGKNIQQIRQLIDRGVAGLLAQDSDIPSQLKIERYGMDKGVAMFQFNAGPVTCIISSLQYEEGYGQALWVAKYIREKLGGTAKICYMNIDKNSSLIPRHTGFTDGLRAAGISDMLVADVTSNPTTPEAGFKVMNSVLQKDPDINVVAGDDGPVVGALAALRAAGKASNPNLMLVGASGGKEALALVKSGTSPLRATTAVHLAMVGYAPAKYTQLWLEGKNIPQFNVFNNVIVDSPEAAKKLSADFEDPARIFEEMANGDDTYCQPLGNISYATHNAYYNGTVPNRLPRN